MGGINGPFSFEPGSMKMYERKDLEDRRQFLKDASKAAGLAFVAPALLSAVSAREARAHRSGPSPGPTSPTGPTSPPKD